MADLPKNQTGEAQSAELEENPTDSVAENLDEAQLEEAPQQQGQEQGEDVKDALEVLIGLQAIYAAIAELTEGNYATGARKVFENFDEYRDAFEGIESVPDELGDLDADEIDALAEQALKIAKAFV